MKELSLNILDIAENSVKAGASLIGIDLAEDETTLTVTISDNGCGMTADFLEQVRDPFCTTRTTRKVGMGIPLLLLAARQTGGDVTLTSTHESADPVHHGTVISAVFYHGHIDFTPLGDIIETLCTLIQCNPHIDFAFTHARVGHEAVTLETALLREVLGEVPLNTYEVLQWIREELSQQYGS